MRRSPDRRMCGIVGTAPQALVVENLCYAQSKMHKLRRLIGYVLPSKENINDDLANLLVAMLSRHKPR